MQTQVEVQTAHPLKPRTEKRVLYHRHVGLNFQGSMFASVHDVATFHHHYVAFPPSIYDSINIYSHSDYH